MFLNDNNDINFFIYYLQKYKIIQWGQLFYTKILNTKMEFQKSYPMEMHIGSIIIPFTGF